MKALAIGSFYEHDSVETDYFRSSKSFLDYDIILINFDSILNEYKTTSSKTYRGKKCLNDDDSVKIKEDIKRRKVEILELLKMGRNVIVYLPEPQICFADTGNREYSGTGRNRQTTRIIDAVDLLSVLPIKVNAIEAQGESIDFKGDAQFAEFWKQNKKHLCYNAYFNEPIGKPIFYIKGTNKVVGSYLKVENGNLIFIPSYYDDKEDEKTEKIFFQSLFKLVEELKKETGDFELPSWSKDYMLPEELTIINNINKFKNDINKIETKISKQKEIIAALEEHKVLFTGTGRALEVATANIFQELGFEVTEGLPGRDDLILKYNSKVAVVEVKGVTKSAAEKHAAQLEKWVSEYYANFEIRPKGILIVNTFKDVQLKDRTEDDFPSQMIGYCKNREHCLITGMQLLCIYFMLKSYPEKKEEVIEEMFNTCGVYEKYLDWSNIISNTQEKL
ncbi:hypothetical protein G9F71_008640 [Clostridium sp. FP2]|uniref:hypothetical protein n=1 Tax=Clostridium sp. FP2 TaxID=2724481 RepID=UPI0013E96E47|nr:hypothetical protein [Clostridium sp. FP2]MBZ9622920.1 hypothetical protein [Clostridium sp. FP2]